jgi:hypothetical protein
MVQADRALAAEANKTPEQRRLEARENEVAALKKLLATRDAAAAK